MRRTEPIMDETRARVLGAQRTDVFHHRTATPFPRESAEVSNAAAVVTGVPPWSRP
jgi:hypothetical protein